MFITRLWLHGQPWEERETTRKLAKRVKKIRNNKACVLFACAAIETLSNKLQTIFWTFQKHYVNFSISHHRVLLTPMWCLSSSIMHQKYITTIVIIFCQLQYYISSIRCRQWGQHKAFKWWQKKFAMREGVGYYITFKFIGSVHLKLNIKLFNSCYESARERIS